MAGNALDKELKIFDYSKLSKVKDKLFDKLLSMHRRDNAGSFRMMSGSVLADDSMPCLATVPTTAMLNNSRYGFRSM